MKAYLFNPESGLYEGETFVEEELVRYDEGITPIAPPPHEAGQVPLFDPAHLAWKVLPIKTVHEQLLEKSMQTPPTCRNADRVVDFSQGQKT